METTADRAHDAARRSERYLELIGVAADVFLVESDLHGWLGHVYRLLPRARGERIALYLPDESGRLAASAVFDDDDARASQTLAVLCERPAGIEPYLALVQQTREALVVSEVDVGADGETLDRSAMILVPIAGRERSWGLLQFFSGTGGRRYDRIDLEFARDLGKLAAFALDNAQLMRRASESLDEARFLAGVGETMVESLDLETRLARFLHAVVPRLADWATINLLQDDGAIETVAIAHRDPAMAETIERLRGPYYGNVETNEGTPVALRSGRSRLLTGVGHEFLARHIRPETLEDVRALGADAAFIVPLVAHGRAYGTLAAMRSAADRPFTEEHMRVIEAIARPAAVAIANAKLFERSASVADAFQLASLPARLPHARGLEFSAFYAAGRSEATVGGDWYDAFALDDGMLAVSIGDVSGNGLQAAVTMGAVRQLIRGAAYVQTDPAALLDAVDRALRAQNADAIVTAFVGIVDPKNATVRYASAGHPPPFLRSGDGRIVELDTVGLPLGLRGGEARATDVACGPASTLVLYTDGLTESTRDVAEGERRLKAALTAAAPPHGAGLARRLHDAVVTDGAHDDVAILTATFL